MSHHSDDVVLEIEPTKEPIHSVGLPPSKSHLIRWLLMAAQSEEVVEISGVDGAALDAFSMKDALKNLGVRIDEKRDYWTVYGVGVNGFSSPPTTLNLHNSGTAFRLLAFACLRIGEYVEISGDSTLERRIDRDFWTGLGVKVEFSSDKQNLPLQIQGPFCKNNITLDGSKTSQHLSAILLSMPSRDYPLNLTIDGDIVSQRHAELSFDIASLCGSVNRFGNHHLEPWKCVPPNRVEIPMDASHISFWKLYEIVHGTSVNIPYVSPDDSIGSEILNGLDLHKKQIVDLSRANDLITPLAASMALGGGGVIFGAGHARHKESNRIEQTAKMLSAFSIQVKCTSDGLEIMGGQVLCRPKELVQTFGDHRMQMTATILATKVGARIEGAELHRVSFPKFLDYIQP
ncbi:MAG: hypothetical protein VYA86_06850 [Candidatus Thermoplasmatota archaeon]|nr:hypothetical protein [Candidatus Thermoplasmatota archaeon]